MSNLFDRSTDKIDNFEDNRKKIFDDVAVEEDNPFIVETEPKRVKVSFTIREDLNEFITIFAKNTNLSKSEVVNIMIAENIKNSKNIAEVSVKDNELNKLMKQIKRI